MVFSSLSFLFIYLPLVILGYYGAPYAVTAVRKALGRSDTPTLNFQLSTFNSIWLFAVNFVFYAWGEPKYVLLMLVSIALNYGCGILIERQIERQTGRQIERQTGGNAAAKLSWYENAKVTLGLCVAANLLILGVFKYADLFLGLFGFQKLGLTLPIGISFYTFQTMTYPIDLYRRDCAVQKSFIKFGTYVALFPQLIAGPIVRYRDVAEQLDFREHSDAKFVRGIERFTIGLAKKVLLANNIGQLWDWYKAAPAQSLTALDAWLGLAAFSFQIYFDFSGYSDMAIGLGRMFGFEFMENFNYPYISKSITEFWRRWHISLSGWFRDYVYIPLGGNRKGAARQILNIAVVWTLTGFWHGANWNFLLWGFYYAVLLIIEKLFLLKLLDKLPGFFRHIYTLVFACLGWALFALEDLDALRTYAAALFGANGLIGPTALYQLRNYGATFVILCLASTPLLSIRLVKPIRYALTAAALLLCTAYLVNGSYNPFLYFRF